MSGTRKKETNVARVGTLCYPPVEDSIGYPPNYHVKCSKPLTGLFPPNQKIDEDRVDFINWGGGGMFLELQEN